MIKSLSFAPFCKLQSKGLVIMIRVQRNKNKKGGNSYGEKRY